MRKPGCPFWAVLLLLSAALGVASSIIPLNVQDHVNHSSAICRGRVMDSSSFKTEDGLIYTRTSIRVQESLKGTFPAIVALVHRGGRVGNEEEFFGLSPRFKTGAEYLLLLQRGPDGTLQCVQGTASAILLHRTDTGDLAPASESLVQQFRNAAEHSATTGADVTDQMGEAGIPAQSVLTGMLGGVGSRFIQPDRGEAIPYLIDAAVLPAGMTLEQATNAVKQALDAWTAVTSLKFRLEGIQSFGQGADTITLNDEKLRIQLHDSYNRIHTPGTLGLGGRTARSSPVSGLGWDLGGNVGGNEFRKTGRGYVVLEATNSSMQVLTTFAEVLCHEIGHALSMAHSIEVPTNDHVLANSIMYFQAHGDGRGAALGSYDPPVIQQIYPSNTAPFYFDRMMDVTAATPQPNLPQINEARLGYDLQTASSNLTVALAEVTSSYGTFSVSGNLLKYTPYPSTLGNGERADPAGCMSYDRLVARVSDGTNASPYFNVRVLSVNYDSVSPTDGIPDHWMVAHFGHAAPQAGDKSRATDDYDGDGLTNLQEYIAGTDPTDATSAQRITQFASGTLQWQAKPYELYEILCTADFIHWTRAFAAQPTNSIGAFSQFQDSESPCQFFRIIKTP